MIKNYFINRRYFLKKMGGMLVGILIFRINRLSDFIPPEEIHAHKKEARYYARTDHLAG